MAEPFDFKKILDFLGSNAGQTVVSGVGAGLSAAGQAKRDASTAAQGAARTQLDLLQMQQNQARAAERPIGESEDYVNKNLLRRAILGGLSNQRSAPGDPAVASAMGTREGGIDLSKILTPELLQRYGNDDMLSSAVARRDKDILAINPHAGRTDLGALGFDAERVGALNQDVDAYQRSMMDREQMQRDKIQAAIDRDLDGQKKTPFWKKLLGVAAPFASFIPGVGPLAAIGINAAVGGLTGGVKGAIGGAATGALGTQLPHLKNAIKPGAAPVGIGTPVELTPPPGVRR